MTGLEPILLAIIGPIVSATNYLFTAIKNEGRMSSEQKRLWFNDHIKPSYDQLIIIDEDYRTQFRRAADLLRNRAELQEIVELLKRERPNVLWRRQEVRESLKSLLEYRAKRVKKPKEVTLFYDYVNAVGRYFNAGSPMPHETWYGEFITRFSKLVAQGSDPFDDDYATVAQGRESIKIAIASLDYAVQRGMPEDLLNVQTVYGKLKAECLAER